MATRLRGQQAQNLPLVLIYQKRPGGGGVTLSPGLETVVGGVRGYLHLLEVRALLRGSLRELL